MQSNTTKTKLKNGQVVFGCLVRYPDPGLVELLALQKWDFLVFDAEHGIVEACDCENMARAAELHGVTPIVRVTTNYQPIILRFMDTGVHGLLVPWINSGEEADRAVRSVKYYPRGIRGLAGVRAADYGQTATLDVYSQQANAETLIIVQVETAQVAQNANDVRWQVEELHRGLKQLTGTEKCQCRKARSQRNHLACCYHAWLSLSVKAKQLNKTIYRVKTDLLRDCLCAELRNPHVPAFQPA